MSSGVVTELASVITLVLLIIMSVFFIHLKIDLALVNAIQNFTIKYLFNYLINSLFTTNDFITLSIILFALKTAKLNGPSKEKIIKMRRFIVLAGHNIIA